MDIERYRWRLLELERELVARIERSRGDARAQVDDSPHDAGDESVVDELKEEELTEAELDWRRLNEVRAALRRIDDGTFGRCVVDGEPIDEKRLEAMPWTPYCLKHQQQIEAASGQRTATL